MSDNKRLIVCLTGMPGAGKSSVASFLKEKGFAVVTMGDAVREEAKRQGLEPTDVNLGKMMLKLRQDLGPGAVGHIVVQKLVRDSRRGDGANDEEELGGGGEERRIGGEGEGEGKGLSRGRKEWQGSERGREEERASTKEIISHNVVVDGIRSVAEVEVLKKVGHVKLLAIHASQATRFKHLKKRGRLDAPANDYEFAGRDKRELSIGVSEAIALANEIISNNNLTLEQLKMRSCDIVKKWLDEITKGEQKD
jgi:dephospho-CoA kinase